MATKFISIAALLLSAIVACNSSEPDITCEGNNRIHFKNNCFYTVPPDVDSFMLNQPFEIRLALPRKFTSEPNPYSSNFIKTEIFATVTIIKLDSLFDGAVNNFYFNASMGKLYRDTINFTTEYLRRKNIVASAVALNGDTSLRGSYTFKPLQRGNYLMAFSYFGAKDFDCSLYRYDIRPNVLDQHLHLITAVTNSPVSETDRLYAYCFKVY
jgi:hypothetical protein